MVPAACAALVDGSSQPPCHSGSAGGREPGERIRASNRPASRLSPQALGQFQSTARTGASSAVRLRVHQGKRLYELLIPKYSSGYACSELLKTPEACGLSMEVMNRRPASYLTEGPGNRLSRGNLINMHSPLCSVLDSPQSVRMNALVSYQPSLRHVSSELSQLSVAKW